MYLVSASLTVPFLFLGDCPRIPCLPCFGMVGLAKDEGGVLLSGGAAWLIAG
jgi:hypothetical protein